jgi:membrane protease YdiL (CAAX protease family)
MSASLKNSVRRHPLVAFFALAFAITWAIVAPLVAASRGLVDIPANSALWFLLHALGAVGPVAAAFIVTAITEGREGVADLLARMSQWRIGTRWQLMAVFSPFLLMGLTLVLLIVFGRPASRFGSLSAAANTPFWLTNLLITALAYGIGQEPGWRGFALPRLEEKYGTRGGTLILTLLVAAWYLPLFAYQYVDLGLVGTLGFLVSLLAVSLWLTHLYNSTSGSVLATTLWHVGWTVALFAGAALAPEAYPVANFLLVFIAGLLIIPISDEHVPRYYHRTT